MASTTSNGATVDNLNVLDTLTSDNIGGSQIIALQDIAYALFATTNATQLQTIDNAFWTDNLTLTFQAAGTGQYYTLWATSLDNFSFAQSDHYGNLLAGSPAVTFSAHSASAFLSAFSSNPSLVGSGLSSTSLLASLDINSSIGKNVFQATVNGQIANVFSYASATDSFNGTGSQWDVINNFKAGVDKLDFRKLLNDNMIVGAQGGQTASSAGLGEFFWKGQQSANTTNLGAAGAFAVWYTTDGSGGSFVYTDTNGDGIADLKVNVTGASTLTPSDFLGVDPPAAFTVKINPIEPSQSNPWLLNSADAAAGVTITGTVANFTSSAHLIVSLNGHNYTATVAANGTWSAVIPASDLAHASLPDGTYTLAAVVKVGSSTAASDSHSVTVDEAPPTVTWAAGATGVEGTAIHLGTLAASDVAGIASLVVSGIPVGATLTDGTASHAFTATSGLTSIDVHTWNLSTLSITPPNDANFSLSAVATDGSGNSTTATEAVAVNPLAATLAPAAASGVEGAAIALNVGLTLNKLAGDAAGTNTLNSLVISAIPVGTTLADGNGHSFTATSGNTSVDVGSWTLASLTVMPVNDTNFVLNLAATEKDAEGNIGPVTTATEAVTVNPLAATLNPGASTGNEDSAIAVSLGAAVNGLSGDHNSFESLIIAGIPIGATLSDGAAGHSFIAAIGSTSTDVSGWNLSSLKITPPAEFEGQFALSVTATERDVEGNLSSPTTTTASLTVNPVADQPLVTAAATTINEDGTSNLTITLTNASDLFEDGNDSVTVTVSLDQGATLHGTGVVDNHNGTFTITAQSAADLSGLTITPATEFEGTVAIGVSAQAHDGSADSTLGTTTASLTVNHPPLVSATIASTAKEGDVLTISGGTTPDADAVLSYQWQYSSDGTTWHDINANGTGSIYTVAESDEGHQLRVVITATDNGSETISTTSNASAAVTDITLAFTTAGSISGTAQEGQTLTAVNGTLNDSDA
ncbi:hypothetical protein, partial [Mesorhizobium sp. B2-4-17]|uniref:beta strand repeat-containing protein n=1 Tax=Mesorhizobium sp. B2-4-17 TaxID=2589932 RepID=UPI0011297A87